MDGALSFASLWQRITECFCYLFLGDILGASQIGDGTSDLDGFLLAAN